MTAAAPSGHAGVRLDMAAFPLVFLRNDAQAPPDLSPEMQLEAVLDRGEAFVLLTDHLPGDHGHDQGHEERKQRALFFKRNKARLHALCKGLVLITGERTVPAPVRLAAQGAGKALGLAISFFAAEHEAMAHAARLLEPAGS